MRSSPAPPDDARPDEVLAVYRGDALIAVLDASAGPLWGPTHSHRPLQVHGFVRGRILELDSQKLLVEILRVARSIVELVAKLERVGLVVRWTRREVVAELL